jgi:hypothetical protein
MIEPARGVMMRAMILALSMVLLVAPAHARWTASGWDYEPHVDLDDPPPGVVTALELREWEIALGLDAEQRRSLRAMADAVSMEFDAAWLEAAEARGRLRETHPGRVHRRAWTLREGLHRRYTELRAQLVSDLELIITRSQRAGWEAFEAGLAQREALGRVTVRGVGSLDLRARVGLMGLDEASLAAVGPILDEHDAALAPLAAGLGRSLESLDRALASFFAERGRLRDEGADRGALQELFKDEVEPAASRAADACARYHEAKAMFARRVAEALPDEEGDELLATVRDAIIERSRRDTEDAMRFATSLSSVARSVELYSAVDPGMLDFRTYGRVARLAEPLTQAQRDTIKEIGERYEREFRTLRRRYGFIEPTVADLGGVTIAGGIASVRVFQEVSRDEAEQRRLERLFEELEPVEARVRREVYEALTVRQRILFRSMVDVD